jgi:Protein of unknown function (DUF4087)
MNPTVLKVAILLTATVICIFIANTIADESSAQTRIETRCGWFSNPTPANAWLIDKDGEWTIGIQGGRQAEGDWPDIPDRQWVETNVHYGYGCACMRVKVNRGTHDILEIFSATPRTLSTCRHDPALKRKEPK